VSSRSLKINEF